jgi:hypothetical protein
MGTPKMINNDTPLFVKTHDFILWLMERTQRFPKQWRHSYTNKLECVAFEFQEAILMANQARGPRRLTWLERADGKLVCLRALLRFAYDLRVLAGSQLEFATKNMDELGRLLGAWIKGTNR